MRQLAAALIAIVSIAPFAGCVRHVVSPDAFANADKEPPPGMIEANVVSDDGRVWDVFAGNQRMCSTPCTEWFGEQVPVTLTTNDGDELYTSSLARHLTDTRRAVVVAEGPSAAKQVNGIVFTTLGGMGLVTAITLAAVGCSDLQEHSGMCTAGLITGGVSVPLTAAAIWMLVDSGPKLLVLPVHTKHADLAVTPAGIAGTF